MRQAKRHYWQGKEDYQCPFCRIKIFQDKLYEHLVAKHQINHNTGNLIEQLKRNGDLWSIPRLHYGHYALNPVMPRTWQIPVNPIRKEAQANKITEDFSCQTVQMEMKEQQTQTNQINLINSSVQVDKYLEDVKCVSSQTDFENIEITDSEGLDLDSILTDSNSEIFSLSQASQDEKSSSDHDCFTKEVDLSDEMEHEIELKISDCELKPQNLDANEQDEDVKVQSQDDSQSNSFEEETFEENTFQQKIENRFEIIPKKPNIEIEEAFESEHGDGFETADDSDGNENEKSIENKTKSPLQSFDVDPKKVENYEEKADNLTQSFEGHPNLLLNIFQTCLIRKSVKIKLKRLQPIDILSWTSNVTFKFNSCFEYLSELNHLLTKKEHFCKICHNKTENLWEHIDIHHDLNILQYHKLFEDSESWMNACVFKCEICPNFFCTEKKNLSIHIKKVHKMKIGQYKKQTDFSYKHKSFLSCIECGKKMLHTHQGIKHHLIKHGYVHQNYYHQYISHIKTSSLTKEINSKQDLNGTGKRKRPYNKVKGDSLTFGTSTRPSKQLLEDFRKRRKEDEQKIMPL